MDKKQRISSFIVVKSEQTDKGLRMQGYDPLTNRTREAELCFNLDNLTGELSVGIFPHYSDPDSEPWWPSSETWEPEEKRA